jgi:ABC-type long-subunit fatty acid transport system fused permease/ATPase subunit
MGRIEFGFNIEVVVFLRVPKIVILGFFFPKLLIGGSRFVNLTRIGKFYWGMRGHFRVFVNSWPAKLDATFDGFRTLNSC